MRQLKITIGDVPLRAASFDTPTAAALHAAAPSDAAVSTWGDELYFGTPISRAREADALGGRAGRAGVLA